MTLVAVKTAVENVVTDTLIAGGQHLAIAIFYRPASIYYLLVFNMI